MLLRRLLFASLFYFPRSAFGQFAVENATRPGACSVQRSLLLCLSRRCLVCAHASQNAPDNSFDLKGMVPNVGDSGSDRAKRPRVRQHVNPLSEHLRTLVELPPEWPVGVYNDRRAPLHIDIGCATGTFLLELSQEDPSYNYVGLEIRRPLVEFANIRAERAHVADRVFFVCCNANAAMEKIISIYTLGMVRRISLNFPDPYFKRRQHKRRVVQPELVHCLSEGLAPGAEVVCQTDVAEVHEYIREVFVSSGKFTAENLSDSPYPVRSEREMRCILNGRQIFRIRFVRC
jgi:tRNA (guanine-N7-)-methyltransferase